MFQLYFDICLQETIIGESNKYAKLVMGEEAYQKWSPITVDELRAFFGFAILMGLNHLPSIEDYWRRDPHSTLSICSDCRQNRGWSHLAPSYDRLGKVRPLIDHLGEKFEKVYNPTQNLAVDEASGRG